MSVLFIPTVLKCYAAASGVETSESLTAKVDDFFQELKMLSKCKAQKNALWISCTRPHVE